MTEKITIAEVAGVDVLAMIDEMLAVYMEVYSEPPYSGGTLWNADGFVERTTVQARRDGFGCVVARDGGAGLLGYAFGVPFAPGSWWSGEATEPPDAVLDAEKFAVIELVLRRPWRGRGIGHRLHDTLLDGRPEPYAILTAMPTAPARQMYARWGWTQIGTARHIPDSPVLDSLVLRLR